MNHRIYWKNVPEIRDRRIISAAEINQRSLSKIFVNYRKGVPNSPRIISTGPGLSVSMSSTSGTSPKGVSTGLIRTGPTPTSRPLMQYNAAAAAAAVAAENYALAQPTTTMATPPQTSTTVAPPPSTVVAVPVHESLRRYVVNGTNKFFGVSGDESNEKVWIDRRRRLAIKLFGGVKDDFHMDGNGHHGNTAYEDSLVNTKRIAVIYYIDRFLFFCSLMRAMEHDYAMIHSRAKWSRAKWCSRSQSLQEIKTLWAV